MKEIKLTRGAVALVDDADFDCLSKHKWSLVPGNGGTPYAAAQIKNADGEWRFRRMHRFLMNPSDPSVYVDHRNGDGLDNRRENLRLATPQENARNRSTWSNKTGFRGVNVRHDCRLKFQAIIRVNGILITIGYFATAPEAAKAYDNAAKEYFKEFCGFLNFPEEVSA